MEAVCRAPAAAAATASTAAFAAAPLSAHALAVVPYTVESSRADSPQMGGLEAEVAHMLRKSLAWARPSWPQEAPQAYSPQLDLMAMVVVQRPRS